MTTVTTETVLDQAEIEETVFLALGSAGMCWERVEDAGVFDSARAKAIGAELVAWIRERVAEPRLGCATTRQLLDEITARIEVDGRLDYRTVDSD